jgi:hypothetical protein
VAADGANPGGFQSISCPSSARCVAADLNGNLVVSTNPTGGSFAWTMEAIDSPAGGANEIGTVSCPTGSLCLASASGSAGNLMFSSTNPAGGVAAWTSVTGVDGNAPIAALICPDASLRVAEDVVTSVDP